MQKEKRKQAPNDQPFFQRYWLLIFAAVIFALAALVVGLQLIAVTFKTDFYMLYTGYNALVDILSGITIVLLATLILIGREQTNQQPQNPTTRALRSLLIATFTFGIAWLIMGYGARVLFSVGLLIMLVRGMLRQPVARFYGISTILLLIGSQLILFIPQPMPMVYHLASANVDGTQYQLMQTVTFGGDEMYFDTIGLLQCQPNNINCGTLLHHQEIGTGWAFLWTLNQESYIGHEAALTHDAQHNTLDVVIDGEIVYTHTLQAGS